MRQTMLLGKREVRRPKGLRGRRRRGGLRGLQGGQQEVRNHKSFKKNLKHHKNAAMIPGLVLFKAQHISWNKEQKQGFFQQKKNN